MLFPLIWIPQFALFCTLSPLKPYVSSTPQKGDPKYARKKNGSLIFPPFLFPPLHPSFTPLFSLFLSLSRAKRLVFPEKETSFNGGTREKKEKKNHPAFLCFFQTAAVSHIASPIHTLTPQEPLPCPNPPQNTTWDYPTPHLPPRLSSLHTPPAHPGV